jgi:hypothetical protein
MPNPKELLYEGRKVKNGRVVHAIWTAPEIGLTSRWMCGRWGASLGEAVAEPITCKRCAKEVDGMIQAAKDNGHPDFVRRFSKPIEQIGAMGDDAAWKERLLKLENACVLASKVKT